MFMVRHKKIILQEQETSQDKSAEARRHSGLRLLAQILAADLLKKKGLTDTGDGDVPKLETDRTDNCGLESSDRDNKKP